MMELALCPEEEKVSYPGISAVENDELLARCIVQDEWIIPGGSCLSKAAFPENHLAGRKQQSISVFRHDKIDEHCLWEKARRIYKDDGSHGFALASAGALRAIVKDGVRQVRVFASPELAEDGSTVLCLFHSDIIAQPDPNHRLSWAVLRAELGKRFSQILLRSAV